MTYEECLGAIHSRKPFSSSASLERITRLLHKLGNPQERLNCVHVAGTNGKGSACSMIESVLRQGGYRVGLFTSPYLVDFRERIQINRTLISKEQLVTCYQQVMEAELALEQAGHEPINEFELVTAIGFCFFAEENVDYTVIEVGLGGRYDATNVITKPAVSCIMPIDLDHTAVLGDTLAQIAHEKAGIIKRNCPVVLAPQHPEAEAVLRQEAIHQNAPVYETQKVTVYTTDRNGQTLQYRDTPATLPLLGGYQQQNMATAWETCRVLGIADEVIAAGMERVRWPGRLQYIPGEIPMLIDAGHNPAGIGTLCDGLDQVFSGESIIAVMAMMKDKNYETCIPMIAQRCVHLIGTTVGLPRSLPPESVAELAKPYCTSTTAPSVCTAIERARAMAKPGQMILICGSVYAAGAALAQIS